MLFPCCVTFPMSAEMLGLFWSVNKQAAIEARRLCLSDEWIESSLSQASLPHRERWQTVYPNFSQPWLFHKSLLLMLGVTFLWSLSFNWLFFSEYHWRIAREKETSRCCDPKHRLLAPKLKCLCKRLCIIEAGKLKPSLKHHWTTSLWKTNTN